MPDCNHNWTTSAIAIQHPQMDEPQAVCTVDQIGYTDQYDNELMHLEICVSCGYLRVNPNDQRAKCLMVPHPSHNQ